MGKMKDAQIQYLNDLAQDFEGAIIADGFEEALIGYGHQFNNPVAVYDYDKCIETLVLRDQMTPDEAIEFMDFNVIGAYMGEGTPVFLMVRT